MNPYRNILVPIDGSDTADRGLEESLKIARRENARVHALYVQHARLLEDTCEPWETRADLDLREQQRLETIRLRVLRRGKQTQVDVRSLVEDASSASIAEIILGTASLVDADLIVMGTHGHSAIRRLVVGSVTDSVLRSARIPVLLVPLGRQLEYM